MTILVKEQIAKLLAKSQTGLRFEEIRRAVPENESVVRFELKEMQTRGYIQKTGATASTRYELTPQGRLMFVANAEKEIVEEFIVEQKPKDNTHEKIDEIKSEMCDCEKTNGMTWCKSNENCRLPTPTAQIEAKPYPFVTDSVIDDELQNIGHKSIQNSEEAVAELLAAAFESFAESKPITDEINNPPHYHGQTMGVIDVIDDFLTPKMIEGYLVGNVIKYVLRYQKKGGVESLKKAQWYLNRTVQDFDLFEEA